MGKKLTLGTVSSSVISEDSIDNGEDASLFVIATQTMEYLIDDYSSLFLC